MCITIFSIFLVCTLVIYMLYVCVIYVYVLQALVSSLMDCSPHYVRCIKSNDSKLPLTVDPKRVQHQVKYLGLAENIKVRRAGYAYRAEYSRYNSTISQLAILTILSYLPYNVLFTIT